jgi:hypothetical protein
VYSVSVMKLAVTFLALISLASAEVPLEKPVSSGSVTVSVRPFGSNLQVFVRSEDPHTARFRVTAAVVVGGALATITGTANRYPDSIAGTYWTTFLIESPGTPERVASISIEEMKITEFR